MHWSFNLFHGPFYIAACVWGQETNCADLLSTAFLQPVYHLLKLQEADLHLLFQLDDERLIVRVQVVVGLLCVQAESWGVGEERETILDEDTGVRGLMTQKECMFLV